MEKEGQTNILLKLLELKFGNVSSDHHKKVQGADSDTLMKWSERLLTANTMEEIFCA